MFVWNNDSGTVRARLDVRLIDAKGRRRSVRVERREIETSGPVRTTVLLEGSIERCRGIRFRCRVSLFHGAGLARVRFTLHNSRRAKHRGGLWDLGDPGSFLFKELTLEIEGSGAKGQGSAAGFHHSNTLSAGEEAVGNAHPTFVEWVAEPGQTAQRMDTGEVAIYQDSSGGANWQSRNHANRDGRVPCRLRGYRVRTPAGEFDGLRANPVVAVGNDGVTLAATVPEFWQQFPKSIVAAKGRITIGLFPNEWNDLHELQGGEQKTHEVWLRVSGGEKETGALFPNGQEGIAAPRHHDVAPSLSRRNRRSGVESLAWVHAPVRVLPTPRWTAASGALPVFAAALEVADDAARPADDRSNGDSRLSSHESGCLDDLMAEAIDGPHNLFARRETIDEYGWRNYGDVYADHENAYYHGPKPIVSHYNNQYDMVYGFLLQWLRGGDSRWFDLAQPLARHVTDIDIYHTTQDRAAYDGGLFWHTDHYRDAGAASHRCYSRTNKPASAAYGGGPSCAHNYATGLLHYYFLTGDAEARRAAIGLADYVIDMENGNNSVLGLVDDGPTGRATESSADYCGPGRGAGNSVAALMDGWLLSREPRYFDLAESLIRRVVHPRDDVGSLHLLDTEARWSYTMFLAAVARYLDVKVEAGEIDEMYAYGQASLVHYARWMLDYELPYFDRPEKLEYPTETWAAQELRKANVLRLAARHTTGQTRDALLARGDELARRAWQDLWRFESRRCTRALALAMIEGVRELALRRGTETMPIVDGPEAFPPRATFIRQKERVRRQLRTLGGLVRAGIRAANPAVWRQVRWSR